MDLPTKEVACAKPGSDKHSVPVHQDGGQACGNCGSWKLVYSGTAPTRLYVKGWCEDHSYCKDCRHITWPGHFTGTYKDGERVIGEWYTRPATESQIKAYEH